MTELPAPATVSEPPLSANVTVFVPTPVMASAAAVARPLARCTV